MAPEGTEPQTGRETRLLVLVVGVSVAVLLLLAQWQFPGASMSSGTPGSAPLVGLAARATFDEMASTMADVVGRVSPLTVAIPLEPVPAPVSVPGKESRSGNGADIAAAEQETPATATPAAWTLGVRVARDLALAWIAEGFAVQTSSEPSVSVVAHDVAREMALVRVRASNASPDTLSASVRAFPSFSYAAGIDATPVGPTAQPIFLGRADTVADARWSHPLVPGTVAPGLVPGTVLFSLNGRLIGMVVGRRDAPMIVPAPAIEALVQALMSPETPEATAP
jgi:hypothetical protein